MSREVEAWELFGRAGAEQLGWSRGPMTCEDSVPTMRGAPCLLQLLLSSGALLPHSSGGQPGSVLCRTQVSSILGAGPEGRQKVFDFQARAIERAAEDACGPGGPMTGVARPRTFLYGVHPVLEALLARRRRAVAHAPRPMAFDRIEGGRLAAGWRCRLALRFSVAGPSRTLLRFKRKTSTVLETV